MGDVEGGKVFFGFLIFFPFVSSKVVTLRCRVEPSEANSKETVGGTSCISVPFQLRSIHELKKKERGLGLRSV